MLANARSLASNSRILASERCTCSDGASLGRPLASNRALRQSLVLTFQRDRPQSERTAITSKLAASARHGQPCRKVTAASCFRRWLLKSISSQKPDLAASRHTERSRSYVGLLEALVAFEEVFLETLAGRQAKLMTPYCSITSLSCIS